ncbi:hypothetical protein P152DRAFT_464202 [Eremomyces bilateralis CBS 781.70]|uniref:C2H2-type domain-containing protein n=1 Tax=Eremomyces bilateralis CBS 781.70 TaxID=1392243 RepID=A0A6G1GFA1_9PEZI|nr:uncharacterized protein P152DRAFT_464202 [Eremomyces bilateralis CBS 781.70]KAF1816748.1 hypothetical protein P152DRAFT_464202 [Eremomyces bilateralis CBS 781.70]
MNPRPTSAHHAHHSRLSTSAISNAMNTSRAPRTHSHSLSVGSINPLHRVTRRKSMSSTAANNAAAMAAAAREISGSSSTPTDPGSDSGRKSTTRSSRGTSSSYLALPSSMPNHSAVFAQGMAGMKNATSVLNGHTGSAVIDGPNLASMPEANKAASKPRIRRASEGSRLSKGEGRRSAVELRCETCGKGYKHSSCLTKHLWEHTPEWSYTSKLLISKHQQVQLLEAASVLVNMNQDGPESSHSSDSPAASSDPTSSPDPDPALSTMSLSSPETTPPPGGRELHGRKAPPSHLDRTHRFSSASNASSALSASYNSTSTAATAVTSPGFSESAPQGRPYMSHYRQWSTSSATTNPTASSSHTVGAISRGMDSISGGGSSGNVVSGIDEEKEDDDSTSADLAAAVGLLSCSYGTPKTGPVMLPPDVPPVPPLPAQYLSGSGPGTSQYAGSISNSFSHFTNSQSAPRRPPVSPIEQKVFPVGAVSTGAPARKLRLDADRDVEMGDHEVMKMEMEDDDEWNGTSRIVDERAMSDDEGMFGQMEE